MEWTRPEMTSKNLFWHHQLVSSKERAELKNQKPAVLWFTGLSGSGKSTLANALELRLLKNQTHTYLLDGDNIRLGLCKDLGFNSHDRTENIRRVAEVCKLFNDAGTLVLSAFITPLNSDRELVRSIVSPESLIEIFVDTPLDVCEKRDPKGLYQKARSGELQDFTGISSPFERPIKPDIHIRSQAERTEDSVARIFKFLVDRRYILKS